jgi:hypothetical protein
VPRVVGHIFPDICSDWCVADGWWGVWQKKEYDEKYRKEVAELLGACTMLMMTMTTTTMIVMMVMT